MSCGRRWEREREGLSGDDQTKRTELAGESSELSSESGESSESSESNESAE